MSDDNKTESQDFKKTSAKDTAKESILFVPTAVRYRRTYFDDIQEGEYHQEAPKSVNVIYSTKTGDKRLFRDEEYVLSTNYADKELLSKRSLSDESYYTDSLTRPNNIQDLEVILSEAYNGQVVITRIKRLPIGRKRVKEVIFLLEDKLSKVWVFKADPKNTSRELAIYKIAYDNGIPTGKPIGFNPMGSDYDIAILGGIVEHAGNAYSELIKNLVLAPNKAHSAAIAVAELIARYQKALTAAEKTFADNQIFLQQSGPEKELKERMVATFNNPKRFEELIGYSKELYAIQSPFNVVSHEDPHDHNIVTLTEYDPKTKQDAVFANSFGIIDWGSLALDHPYSDIMNFWVHHKRLSDIVFKDYPYDYTELVSAYDKIMGLPLNPDDALIQLALWNIYEMFDPLRKDPKDIQSKAEYHFNAAKKTLDILNDKGYVPAKKIKTELESIFKKYSINQKFEKLSL